MAGRNAGTSSQPGIELIGSFRGHKKPILRLAWSPDGKRLATPSVDGTVRVWQPGEASPVGVLRGHEHGVNSAAWSPDMQWLATTSFDQSVRIWNGASGAPVATVRDHEADIPSLSWSSDGAVLATASEDRSVRLRKTGEWTTFKREPLSGKAIRCAFSPRRGDHRLAVVDSERAVYLTEDGTLTRLWNRVSHSTSLTWSPDARYLALTSRSGLIRIYDRPARDMMQLIGLEGHTDVATDLSFSADGRLLATKAMDGTIRLWSTEKWAQVGVIQEPNSAFWPTGIAFHPTLPTLATLGDWDCSVRLWHIDIDRLTAGQEGKPHLYRNAKVVFVGESGVGKSGLALVLTAHNFEPTDSTHGRRVLPFSSEEVPVENESTEKREILIWDLAGQAGYRLVHQLSLHQAAVAVVVFDSRSETDPTAGIEYWCRAIEQAQQANAHFGMNVRKILVSARTDRSPTGLTRAAIEALLRKYRFDSFFETSAKDGRNIRELGQAIRDSVDWPKVAKVSSNAMFERMKEFLVREKTAGRLLCTRDELYSRFLDFSHINTDVRTEFETCLENVSASGLLRLLRFGGFVLLQPELLEAYEAHLLSAARAEPSGLGSILMDDVLGARFYLPESDRLQDRETEKLLLHATVEDLLRHEIALKEVLDTGLFLVFPSQFMRDWPEAPDPPGRTVSFRFQGPVVNIYTTLVVRLSHGGLFKRSEMWRNAALFASLGSGSCGIYLRSQTEGEGEIVLFSNGASEETQLIFEHYVSAHLERRSVVGSVERSRVIVCPTCAEVMSPSHVHKRLQLKFTTIRCPVCDTEINLRDGAPRLSASTASALQKIDDSADTVRDKEAAEQLLRTKREQNHFDVFLSYSSVDESAIRDVYEKLLRHGILPWFDKEEILAGDNFMAKLQEAIRSIDCVAVFIGDTMRPWQTQEMEAALTRRANAGLRLIPVILPNTAEGVELPLFLESYSRVDRRAGFKNAFTQLVRGIDRHLVRKV